MNSNRVKTLRIAVIVILVLLALQYELGISVIMADAANIPPFAFSVQAVSEALRGVGPVALVHASMGGLLLLLSLITMALSLLSRVRGAQIWGTLAFLSILSAAYGGLAFVLSGFQNDNSSHNMASDRLLSFTFISWSCTCSSRPRGLPAAECPLPYNLESKRPAG